MNDDEMAAALAEKIADRCFGGRLPDAPLVICLAVAMVCFPHERRENVLRGFFETLLPALEARITWQNARWVC
jgi:hypothetical protein